MMRPIAAFRWIRAVAVSLLLVTTAAHAANTPLTPELVQELLAADGAAGDQFGYEIASDATTIAVSASGTPRAVYVFEKQNGVWTQTQKLTASDPADIAFGISVAVQGNTIAVGTGLPILADFSPDYPPGAIYVYTRVGSTWTQQARLTAPEGLHHDAFGFRFGLNGDTIGTRTRHGSALIFTRANGVWSLQDEVFIGRIDEQTAHYTAGVAGDYFWLGMQGSNGIIFLKRTGTTWQALEWNGGDPGGAFYLGRDVIVDGDTVVLGGSGSLGVYVRHNDAWELQQVLPENGHPPLSGDLIALHGDTLIAGQTANALSVFTRTGETWTQSGTISDPRAICSVGLAGVDTPLLSYCQQGAGVVEVLRLTSDNSADPPTLDAVAGDGILNLAEARKGITIKGNGEPGAKVKVFIGALTNMATVKANGRWGAPFTAAQLATLPEGKLVVSAFQTDVAGNVSLARTVKIRKDTIPPAITQVSPFSIHHGLIVTGRGEAGASVTVAVGSIKKDAWSTRSGLWGVILNGVPAGTVKIIVTSTDAAGNKSTLTRIFRKR